MTASKDSGQAHTQRETATKDCNSERILHFTLIRTKVCASHQNSLHIPGSLFTWLPVYKHIPTQSSWEREICIFQFEKPANIQRAFSFQWSRGWILISTDPSTGRLSKTGCDQNKGLRGTETPRDWGNPIIHPHFPMNWIRQTNKHTVTWDCGHSAIKAEGANVSTRNSLYIQNINSLN